jgi:hypothetical protein
MEDNEQFTQDEQNTPRKYDGRKNLVPITSRTPEERAEMGRKGGLKAQQCNKERRTAQEIMRSLLECPVDRAQAEEKLGPAAKFLPEGATLFDLISLAQIATAGDGSTKAFEAIRDTAGYKPIEQHEITAEVMTDADRALLQAVAARTGADQGEK